MRWCVSVGAVLIAGTIVGGDVAGIAAPSPKSRFADTKHVPSVNVELVIAVDVSYSMDMDELAIQREGYAQAIVSKDFLQALRAGPGSQFLYNTTTRSVMWDSDGSGAVAGIALATLQTGAVVSAGNFAISGGNNSTPVAGNISINDVAIAEGDCGTKVATFTVSHTGTAAFSVNYATANGSATAGSDYVATSNTLNFAAGSGAAQSQTVSVTISGDTTVEPDESFFVNLLNATNGGTIVKSQGIGTITNDDTAGGVGNISIADVTIAEGNAGTSIATFTVTRTGGNAAF